MIRSLICEEIVYLYLDKIFQSENLTDDSHVHPWHMYITFCEMRITE
jgi:hypothetical protein